MRVLNLAPVAKVAVHYQWKHFSAAVALSYIRRRLRIELPTHLIGWECARALRPLRAFVPDFALR